MLVLMPLLMLVMGIATPFIHKASAADKESDETNRSVMQEYLSRIMLIKVYFMQDKIVAGVESVYGKKLKSGMRLGLWEGVSAFWGLLVSMSIFMVARGFGAYFVMQGETTLGSLIAIVQLLNYIVNPLEQLSATISQVSQAIASSQRIGAIYELPADKKPQAAQSTDAVELTAENVSFAYNEEGNTLNGISVSFKRGEVTGIVGESGGGKSTFLKLLMGLHAPKQGTVTLKTVTGEEVEIMPQVAYVPPEDYLLSGTVAENIVMNEENLGMPRLEAAASDANILEFVESLPNGFDSLIGESGGTVSSGQAQRFAIARAIYKQAPVIIFDEPTANLDAQSIEQFKLIARQLDKICIIVTHDESTISICDKVYVLEDGCVSSTFGDELYFVISLNTA